MSDCEVLFGDICRLIDFLEGLPTGCVNNSAMSRSWRSLDEMRMTYFTPPFSSTSKISGLAKAASARNTTSLPRFCCRSISGSSGSSQS
jgi:hypothetical protein